MTIAATVRRSRPGLAATGASARPSTLPTARPAGRSFAARGAVHVVSGSYGAGHDAAARGLAARFGSRGYPVVTHDVVDMFPARLGRLLRAAYFRQLQSVPGTWDWLLRRLEADGVFHRGVTRALGAVAGDRLADALSAPAGPVLVVSTHPFASQALGHLRLTGRLDAPVATYLTDMSVHPLWTHPGVDVHLALHELPAAAARARGVRAEVVGPLTRACPIRPIHAIGSGTRASRAEARVRLGLPVRPRLALVTGGSLGIGELEQAAHDIAATGLATPVVLCGQNAALRARLAASPDMVALGWRDDVSDLLAVVDCVVQNAGGFTSLEALAAGVPTLSYRCLPGHGLANAHALHDAGWVPWADSPATLADVLPRLLARGPYDVEVAWRHRTSVDVVDLLEGLLVTEDSRRVPA